MELNLAIYWDSAKNDHIIEIKRKDLQCSKSCDLLKEVYGLLQRYILDRSFAVKPSNDPIESDITTVDSNVSGFPSNRILNDHNYVSDKLTVSRCETEDRQVDDGALQTDADDEQTLTNDSLALESDNG